MRGAEQFVYFSIRFAFSYSCSIEVNVYILNHRTLFFLHFYMGMFFFVFMNSEKNYEKITRSLYRRRQRNQAFLKTQNHFGEKFIRNSNIVTISTLFSSRGVVVDKYENKIAIFPSTKSESSTKKNTPKKEKKVNHSFKNTALRLNSPLHAFDESR